MVYPEFECFEKELGMSELNQYYVTRIHQTVSEKIAAARDKADRDLDAFFKNREVRT